MTPGELIRRTRMRHNLSQESLAIRVATKQSAISRLEHDEVSPTVETLQELLTAMGERLELTTRPVDVAIDPTHRREVAGLSPPDRLRMAMSWNRLAGRLAIAGRSARQDA